MSVSVGFISLGCAKNLVDSQIMAGYLKAGKITLAEKPEKADIILINTCAFIDISREEAAETILSACEHKLSGQCSKVIVTGCMVQRYKERMIDAFPDVDGFLGVDELDRIAELVDAVQSESEPALIVTEGTPKNLFNPIYPTMLFTGAPFAYLKIAEGCNHRCAYCSIPDIRGDFRSREVAAIVEEASVMVRAGVKELNVISQDTLNYGRDSNNSNQRIETLLRELDRLEGDFWIRVLYGYPSNVSEELLDLFCESKHIVPYLDLPVQHSHPEILKAMNRAHAVDAVQNLTERLRARIPGIVLRTTCLVGFPGESSDHFMHLLEYIKRSRFDHLGVFVFSPEEGTPAYDMDNVPSLEIAEERQRMVMELQYAIVSQRHKELFGSVETLMLERKQRKNWIGRLMRQAPDVDGETIVSGVPENFAPGDFIQVEITGDNKYDFNARFVEAGLKESFCDY